MIIRFEYRPDPEKRKQADLNTLAAQAVFNVTGFANWKAPLAAKVPTEKNPDRTLLEKHVADYTARNTFDYFIHKDIGGFLRRELDFFIKNEIMHLDDIEDEQAPRVEQYLAKVKAIRAIARKIIAFLEQLENFQKKLWLKKKFVVETNYCVTLDRVPESLYPEIVASDAQRSEWVSLFAIDEIQADLAKPAYSVPLNSGVPKGKSISGAGHQVLCARVQGEAAGGQQSSRRRGRPGRGHRRPTDSQRELSGAQPVAGRLPRTGPVYLH